MDICLLKKHILILTKCNRACCHSAGNQLRVNWSIIGGASQILGRLYGFFRDP
jgi:hypothetical protein